MSLYKRLHEVQQGAEPDQRAVHDRMLVKYGLLDWRCTNCTESARKLIEEVPRETPGNGFLLAELPPRKSAPLESRYRPPGP